MRVLYFSDVVPVELNAGYMLMYRHLARMHSHEVLILTSDNPKVRGLPLPRAGVRFPERSRNFVRITNRVGSPFFWLEQEASRLRRLARPHALKFRPDLVLTVWHSAYLLAAADLAEELKLPLVLICHDDYEKMLPEHPRKRAWASQRLRSIYQRARICICVSHGMVEHMNATYGKSQTEIVYPIPAEAPFPDPPARVRSPGDPLRIGFFGELGGNYGPINAVVDVLKSANAEFHFFSHTTGSEREALACRQRVFDHGATDPRGLHEYFRANIDVVLIPQGFEPSNLQLFRTCFPSKLPEACQIGLPLLIVAPAEGSAARWGQEYLQPAAVVSTLDEAALLAAIRSFCDGAIWQSHRKHVAHVSARLFRPEKLQQQFESALSRAGSPFLPELTSVLA